MIVENPFNAIATKPTTVVIYNGKSIYRKENTIKVFPAADQYEHQVTKFSNELLNKTKADYDLLDAKKYEGIRCNIYVYKEKIKWIKI